MTTIDLGVMVREGGEMVPVEAAPSPVAHAWQARHRRPTDRNVMVFVKLSGAVAVAVAAVLVAAGLVSGVIG